MKKFAALAVVAVSFLSPLDSSEAQVLRRFRNNIREAIIPQALPQQVQSLDAVQPQARILPHTTSGSDSTSCVTACYLWPTTTHTLFTIDTTAACISSATTT